MSSTATAPNINLQSLELLDGEAPANIVLHQRRALEHIRNGDDKSAWREGGLLLGELWKQEGAMPAKTDGLLALITLIVQERVQERAVKSG